MLASVLLVKGVWVLALLDVSFIDCPAPVSTSQAFSLGVSKFYLGLTTDGAVARPLCFINLR